MKIKTEAEMPKKVPTYHLSDAAKEVMKMKRRKSYYRYKKPIHALWELFSDYSNISTVHGVRYLGEKKRHWVERIFWIIAFTASVGCCTMLVIDVWKKWAEYPVIVSFEEKSTPIYAIPFPSVTICPQTKVRQTVFNYTAAYHKIPKTNLTKDFIKNIPNLDLLKSVAKICQSTTAGIISLEGNHTDASVYKHLREVAPTLNATLSSCSWINQRTNCAKIFHEIWTDEGLCFTFNYLNASEMYKTESIANDFPMVHHNSKSDFWDAEQLVYKREVKSPFPYRAFSASDGLSATLSLDERDIDYLCGGPVQGFKILLHTAGEAPQLSKYFFRIPLGHEVLISVRPNIMATSPEIKSYEAKRRKCFFSSEREQKDGLNLFMKYTQRNCELECTAKTIVDVCGCLPFSTPRSNTTKICGLANLACVQKQEFRLSKRESYSNESICDCYPACTSILYDGVISQAKYDLRELLHAKNSTQKMGRKQFARVFISFKENQFFASRRSELYGKIDFIASIGGIMGLFMGVSLLSIVEFFYFGTLRLGCNLRSRRIEKRRLSEKQRFLSPASIDAPSASAPTDTTDTTEIFPENKY